MQTLSQNKLITLLNDINNFAEGAENLINTTRSVYDSEKEKLSKRHNAEVNNLHSSYNLKYTALRQKSEEVISNAQNILDNIVKLESKLALVDKYYVKTKHKKEAVLADKTSEQFNDVDDYFEMLNKIQDSYTELYKKYSQVILPGLINGLNYFFSSKRKKEYEELIILKNTAAAFVTEIGKELTPLIEENIDDLKKEHNNQYNSLIKRQRDETTTLEKRYNAMLDGVAGKICEKLDSILPDDLVLALYNQMIDYIGDLYKVNGSNCIKNDILYMCFVDYPIDYLVSSKIVASLIKEKCAKILTKDQSIRLPVALNTYIAPAWLIIGDNSNPIIAQSFIHSFMFGMLSVLPVSKIVYTIIDPENRGNSVSPFFDAKKKLPDLFRDICINKEDIRTRIAKINEKIERILQDNLGNQYESIFDYAKDNSEYNVEIECVIICNFPKEFDENMISDLRNVIRYGSKCGIYTCISTLANFNTENTRINNYEQYLKEIQKYATTLTQNTQGFYYRGLPLTFFSMPDKIEFAKYFSKYMLIFEGIKNRGIAFSPFIKKLIDAKESADLETQIASISSLLKDFDSNFACVPDLKAAFPAFITLGSILYPADIFSDSVGYQRILDFFGVDKGKETSNYVELPLVFDIRERFNLYLNAAETNGLNMVDLTHHIIWSFLSFIPVSKVNICIFDTEQRGNSIIPFLDFRKQLPALFDEKIYTSSESISERLRLLNTQIDDFIQEKLGNQYKDIFDYNTNAQSRAEGITLLINYDFPSGLDGRCLDLLTNVLRNGNKCGVYTVLCFNPNVKFVRYENIEERIEHLKEYCAMIDYKDNNYKLLPYNLQINVPPILTGSTANNFIREYVAKNEIIKKQGLSFKDIVSKNLFSRKSSKSLHIPVGIGDGDSIVDIVLGEGSSHHGLIAGATGSGKSTLLHTLIMSSMLHYTPEELNLYLMDFKSGTEFKIYESVKLPHIKLLALDAMQEFGESILENLISEMERRGSLFKNVGQTSLNGYVQTTGLSLPRILVIMDEFQILFNDSTNRKVAMHCAELTKRLVTEGRAFGLHLLIATQSTKVITDLTLSRGTIEQMRIRIGLKCGEDDARYLFSDQNDTKALTMMKGPIGTAVMNLDYTELPNIGFRAAYCDENTQREFLEQIAKAFEDRPYTLQTFEGGRTIKLLNFFSDNRIGLTEERPIKIHMGMLIKVAPPFFIQLDKKRKHNLLVCGSNEHMESIITGNYMISALLNRNVMVYCADGDYFVGDETSLDFYNTLSSIGSRFKVAYDYGDIIRFINEIYDKFLLWKKSKGNEDIIFIIRNLQFIDLIKSLLKGDMIDETEFIDEEPVQESENNSISPFAEIENMLANKGSNSNLAIGEKLIKLIEEGSGFGIHFIISSLEYQVVRETMYYGQNVLNKFPERIIFSLGDNDSDNLIENVSVSGLRDNTVYFTDGIKNTFQMKPYVTPTAIELKNFFASLLES